jgi:hypothetical protein
MKHESFLTRLGRAMITAFCIAGLSSPSSLLACAGSSGLVCVVNPAACLKSMVLGKAVPMVVVLPLPGAPATTLAVPITLFITCPLTNNCGNPCPGVGGPVSASLAVGLYPGPCPAPPPPLPLPALSGAIGTATATMALPTCAPLGPGFNAYVVPVTLPAGTPPGIYCVVGTATVTFPGGMVLTQTGDTTVCLVEPVPGRPGVPRLNLELLSAPVPRMAPGDQALARYRITNNDPSNSVTLTAFGTSRQSAVRPQGGNEVQGVFAISSPFGDDFPILFEPGTNCIPLPSHPYTQPEISRVLPTLRPGQSTNISLGIRSYGACASGSCSESTVRLAGAFSDGRPALACAGTSLFVDTSLPSQNWGRDVNDCNHNGIPDALDIATRRSADQNYNAMPDECEGPISIPYFSSVAPNNPLAGAPLQVAVAINETVPMVNVWANGSPLVRTQQFGQPFWVGTIPADTRPGPQTVYFLGKDVQGGMVTYLAPYQVTPPPRITGISVNHSNHVILNLSAASTGQEIFLEETPALTPALPTVWTIHPQPLRPGSYDAGLAVGQRFFRLNTAAKRCAEDWDGDGEDDHFFWDRDGDGKIDGALVDNDEDGKYEEAYLDKDQDGTWDTMQSDTNDDGKWDEGKYDLDGDGKFEKKWKDKNGNGRLDDGELEDIRPPENAPKNPRPRGNWP